MISAQVSIMRKEATESVWPDLAAKLANDEVIAAIGGDIGFAIVEGGTASGRPTVAMRIDLPDGRVVLYETTLALLISVMAAARGAFPEAFAGGPFAGP